MTNNTFNTFYNLQHIFSRGIDRHLRHWLPDVTNVDVYVDHLTYRLVLVVFRQTKGMVTVELMSRYELDRCLGRTIFSVIDEMVDKVNAAFGLIEYKNTMADGADEYDEILQAQDAMAKISP